MAKKKTYAVKFCYLKGNSEVQSEADEDFQRNHSGEWLKWLTKARQNKKTTVVTCLCRTPETEPPQRRLKVSLSEDSSRGWLSSFAYTGHQHNPDCRFYSVWADPRQAEIYQSDVVTAEEDGTILVRLPTGLQKKAPSESPPEKSDKVPDKGKRRKLPSMRLLGLLHLIWEQAEINVWYPFYDKNMKRSAEWVGSRLHKFAAKIKVGRVPLQNALLLLTKKGTTLAAFNRKNADEATTKQRRLILVSILASWSPEREARLDETLPLGFFAGFPDLLLPDDVLQRLKRSFPRELADWRKGSKVVVIAEIDPPEKKFSSGTVIDVALMTVSERFIPLDSGYEKVVEEKLWQEKRAFIKPLRYDGEDDVFPDFVLKDVAGADALPMEVFGMNTPEYLQRKQVKTDYYDTEYGPGRWWSWNAADHSDMPAFPSFSGE
ncbi:DUF1173 domain-containing protein [Pantoea ananatis]|uniref:DUF1173 domain-containing protein n=1 Tax=Pantoea ananas TaxID=553 RepID=UPI0021F78E09|nr:DUF1173 domain-containing protein [Pantoea ananatis]MCW0351048.1 hypothetical protein [Pantoea ananatis]